MRWLPLLGLLLVAALAVFLVRPPQPLPAEAPAPEFAAGRALHDLTLIARQPHSLGTLANAAVRNYLVRRCRALGLQVNVQDTSVLFSSFGQLVGGRVQNVIARQPGQQPGGKAVLVVAHYDSQSHTPGAGDDGAGVAAMLETIRALRAGPPLMHDVIWLFTDGEEAGLLGARAYAADTGRLRREIGVALNFEGRGNRGASITFEVNSQNGWVMREYAKAAPVPLASSLFYEVYRNLPNDTDFTPLRQAGLTGLNFAYTGGYSYYHSPADTPAHLDLGSLQHQGSYMLHLVQHFGTVPLTQTKAPDYTFFNPLGHWLVLYPAAWNLPLTLLTLAVLLGAVLVAYRRGRLSWPGLLGGVAAWLGGLLLLLASGYGLLTCIKTLYPQYQTFYDNAFYNVRAYQVALLLLGAAIFTAYYSWLSRRRRPDALVGGALLPVALLLSLLQWRAASSAFLLLFPLLFASLGWGLRVRLGESSRAGRVAAALLLLPAVMLLSPTIDLVLTIFGGGLLVLAALLVLAVLLGMVLPALLPTLSPRFGLTKWALAGTVGALAVGHATSQPTAAKPQQTHLYYTLDADQRRAYWLSALAQPDAWMKQVFTRPQHGSPLALYAGPASGLSQAAPVLSLHAPQANLLLDSLAKGHRYLRLLVQAGRPGVQSLRLLLPAADSVRVLRWAGHRVPLSQSHRAQAATLTLFAPQSAGETLDIELATITPFQLMLTSRSLGLPPAAGLPPLPATFVPAPGFSSFTTQVVKQLQY